MICYLFDSIFLRATEMARYDPDLDPSGSVSKKFVRYIHRSRTLDFYELFRP
jgi:hypothetical protein